jgi:ATP-dependent Clp protease protease subunit
LYSKLLKERIIQLDEQVDDKSAALVRNQLLYLDSIDSNKDIHLYINSPGGVVSAGLAIVDTINMINADVATYCVGVAASMGAVIFAAGKKGKRFITPYSEIMIHQPSGGMQGKSEDMEIATKHIMRLKKKLYDFLAKRCDKTYEEIESASRLDNWLTAEEAIEFGIADKILVNEKKQGGETVE